MGEKYFLKLYVTGETAASRKMVDQLQKILKHEYQDRYSLAVIDILKNPELAEEDKILATPTLIKKLPPPIKKIIGDLSTKDKVFKGLALQTK